jgi:hypothetical protein
MIGITFFFHLSSNPNTTYRQPVRPTWQTTKAV